MSAPVKISELPAISSVQPNDILPVVDAALTQTSKCTASQIAAIGGGPPGDGTVTTGKIANGAATAPKVGFTGPDKLISRTLTGAGEGVEIPCTSYARGLLATSSSAGALSYLGGLQSSESPTFTGTVTVNGGMSVSGAIAANGGITGQVRAGDGTAAAPSYSFSGDPDTGIARLGGAGTLSIICNGQEQFRFLSDGSRMSPVGASMFAEYGGIRAWARITGHVPYGKNISSIQQYATGKYYIYFSSNMPDTLYGIFAMNGFGGGEAFTRYATMWTHAFELAFVDTNDSTGPTTGSWQQQTEFMVVVVR